MKPSGAVGAVVVCKKKKKYLPKMRQFVKSRKSMPKWDHDDLKNFFFSPPQAYWLDLQGRWMEGKKKPEFHLIFLLSPDRSA